VRLFTSPRVRGEVAALLCAAGEGDSRRTVLVEIPRHPNPLPARGARGRTAIAASTVASWFETREDALLTMRV
jgi:hypothetical protein